MTQVTVLRWSVLDTGRRLHMAATPSASLMMAVVEGRMAQYLRSGFKRKPDADWAVQWTGVQRIVFGDATGG